MYYNLIISRTYKELNIACVVFIASFMHLRFFILWIWQNINDMNKGVCLQRYEVYEE